MGAKESLFVGEYQLSLTQLKQVYVNQKSEIPQNLTDRNGFRQEDGGRKMSV